MFAVFNFLDRTLDTLGHAFDTPDAPEAPRSQPQNGLFLIALALVPCFLYLGAGMSPLALGILGLIVSVVCMGLLAVWEP